MQATLVDRRQHTTSIRCPNQSEAAPSTKKAVLTNETDRNGNTITLAYNAEKQLESVTDGAGRKLTFKYNGSGEVESVKDPMGHTVKYTYESGNLASVTQPGETKIRWKFKYNSEHELTSETDGREHTVTTEYNEAASGFLTNGCAVTQTLRGNMPRSKVAPKQRSLNPTVRLRSRSSTNTDLPTSVTHASGHLYRGDNDLRIQQLR